MRIDREDQAIIGIATLALAGVWWAGMKLLPIGAVQSRYALPPAGLPSDPGKTPSGFLDAREFTGDTVILPHRYPARAGHEISTLIEFGMAPLFRPRPQDYDWYATPPSESVLL